MNFNMNPPTTNTAKYKTMLCKHFETSKGCAFKEKCQFAHGLGELRSSTGGVQTSITTQKVQATETKKVANPQNYKIVKCKYWEKEGTCRYGTLCTFAHGDTEIRSKTENLLLNQQQMGFYDMNTQVSTGVPGTVPGMGYPDPNFGVPFGMMNPYAMGFDPNLMMNPNMMMGMPPQGFDPNMMMNMMGLNMNPNYPVPFPNQLGGQTGTGQQNTQSGNTSNGNTN